MKQNWTQEQVNQIIAKVARNHAQKTFENHDQNDIQQEVWIICLKALDKFDLEKIKTTDGDMLKALEHFLNKAVQTRLYNLFRDRRGIKLKPRTSDTESSYQFRLTAANPVPLSQSFDIPVNIEMDDEDTKKRILDAAKILTLADFELLYSYLSNVDIGPFHRQRLADIAQLTSWTLADE